MKRYITFVLVAMSLVGLVACSNDNGIAAPDGEAQVALRFESSSMTRATVDGDTDLNENLIKTIDCYFYPAEATKDTRAVWHQKFDFVDEDNGIAGKQSTATVTDILMPSSEMNEIFVQGTTGKIYAIANYAGGAALPTSGANTTVAELKEMVVTTAWLNASSTFQTQPSFVMDSEMVEITKSDNTISGTVPLFRTAAKVELTITGVEETVSSTTTSADGTQTTTWYVPAILDTSNNPTGVNVTMNNARTKAGVGGIAQTYSKDSSLKLENYGFSTSTVAGALYKQTNPFYTYPHTWESSEQEASLLLVVYWQATDKDSKEDTEFDTVGDAIPCYYEIPIGLADNKEIVRNHIYQIGINVGTLGSFVKEDPVLLTPSYMVVDWGTGDISAQIKGQRYLVVDKKKIEIFNQTSGFVGYNSSHDVEIIIDKIEYDNYREDNIRYVLLNASGKSYTTDTNSTPATNLNDSNDTHVYADYSATLNTTARTVTVNHSLTNKLMYVPHKIYVTIRHTDNNQFSEQIEFIQYPPIYIIAKPNSKPNSDGGVFVNHPSDGYYGGVHGLTGNNKNPNMYVINVTALSASYDGRIGDPRSATINNQLSNNSTTWSYNNTNFLYAESGVTQRRLTYYYPSANNTQDIIAPQFRNASSYGVTNSVSWQNAQNRCATYQEDGYPAGRWRIPTEAEIKFIASLSADHFIPRLFGSSDTSNTYYWTGSGTLFASKDKEIVEHNNQITSTYVRCVYDEWYWGSEQLTNKTTFTWGDMPR